MTSLRTDGLPVPPFRRVLIANRGEIAVRIVRACRELGIETVAIYSDADAHAGHVRAADIAVRIGPPPPRDSYLRIDAVVDAAVSAGAEAVHPGYGFLAERAAFARAVVAAGMAFIGPDPDAIEALGDKLRARRLARSVDVPVVPGTLEPAPVGEGDDLSDLLATADGIGYPVLVKAAAGGGGRGMRRVSRREDLADALRTGSAEALSAFGDGAVYLEREIGRARHVEVQLLADHHGTVVALGERDCSLQRRHQKLVEEAPAPGLSADQRAALHAMAVRLGEAAGLRNAATCEFLLDTAGDVWFLEVNTRLQVEHGVTELVAGVDIVVEQLRIAAGRPLSEHVRAAAARAAAPTSHAIEARISAEDPAVAFAPTPGTITAWRMPSGPGVRVDTAIERGDVVPAAYDNLIAKLMVHAADREAAVARLARALDETWIGGIQTTLPFHRHVATSPAFTAAMLSTGWVDEHWSAATAGESRAHAAATARLVAGLAAAQGSLAAGADATPGRSGSGAGTIARALATPAEPPSAWRRAARAAAVDRWHR